MEPQKRKRALIERSNKFKSKNKLHKKKNYKVKRFKTEWKEKDIDGIGVICWLSEDPNNAGRALCRACNSTFQIGEGWSAVFRHHKTQKHLNALRQKDIL